MTIEGDTAGWEGSACLTKVGAVDVRAEFSPVTAAKVPDPSLLYDGRIWTGLDDLHGEITVAACRRVDLSVDVGIDHWVHVGCVRT